MDTKIFRHGEIAQAAAAIKRGELVAFPTETVYGLGAEPMKKPLRMFI